MKVGCTEVTPEVRDWTLSGNNAMTLLYRISACNLAFNGLVYLHSVHRQQPLNKESKEKRIMGTLLIWYGD